MTERLYYADSYLRSFRAQVVEAAAGGLTVYLDRTAFYPASGGQPCDAGSIAGHVLLDVIDEDERIAHRSERAPRGRHGRLHRRLAAPLRSYAAALRPASALGRL